jgi:hypothetical protein
VVKAHGIDGLLNQRLSGLYHSDEGALFHLDDLVTLARPL